ncbi:MULTISPECIES: tetratricopeptide repeat protein [unclassified Arthrobacter]|uniref:tetratricopeptide repeat protein n=1 Tax=unclassified Arthrobacter TaxID=235627 RepID=UPI002E0ADD26|nr:MULTISPECIES: tetratricopeptide repeat protein [unclassified Arthrobacter]MEC5192814.1 tetratricopeptide (TPR) repeat protein [Arthrobacter sp. MP_M4]MEC5204301.1 tetratricopeptide (TPR) repeat protein [Arthrobacter sp. MP_M7]
MTMDEWERRVAAFWTAFEAAPTNGDEIVAELDELAAASPAPDGRADFERACIRDSTGRTADAVSFYEAGLAAGLDPLRLTRTCVQMASSQRALGHSSKALEILSHADPHALGGAPSAVRALALRDAGGHDEALRVALEALIPHLPRYQQSMANYAKLLTDS